MADQSDAPTSLLDPEVLERAEHLSPSKPRELIFVARAQLHALSLKLNGHDHEAVSALIHAGSFANHSDALATGAPGVPERYRADVVAGIRRWVQDTDLRLAGAIGPSAAATDALQREALVDWLEIVANQVRREGRDVDLATDNAIRGWRTHTTAERHALLEASRRERPYSAMDNAPSIAPEYWHPIAVTRAGVALAFSGSVRERESSEARNAFSVSRGATALQQPQARRVPATQPHTGRDREHHDGDHQRVIREEVHGPSLHRGALSGSRAFTPAFVTQPVSFELQALLRVGRSPALERDSHQAERDQDRPLVPLGREKARANDYSAQQLPTPLPESSVQHAASLHREHA